MLLQRCSCHQFFLSKRSSCLPLFLLRRARVSPVLSPRSPCLQDNLRVELVSPERLSSGARVSDTVPPPSPPLFFTLPFQTRTFRPSSTPNGLPNLKNLVLNAPRTYHLVPLSPIDAQSPTKTPPNTSQRPWTLLILNAHSKPAHPAHKPTFRLLSSRAAAETLADADADVPCACGTVVWWRGVRLCWGGCGEWRGEVRERGRGFCLWSEFTGQRSSVRVSVRM